MCAIRAWRKSDTCVACVRYAYRTRIYTRLHASARSDTRLHAPARAFARALVARESRAFLTAVVSEDFKPRVEIDLLRRTEGDADGGVVLLFTDCAEEEELKEDASSGRSRVDGVSFFVFDPRDNAYHSGHGDIPPSFQESYFKERKTYIGVGEECAAVGAFYNGAAAIHRASCHPPCGQRRLPVAPDQRMCRPARQREDRQRVPRGAHRAAHALVGGKGSRPRRISRTS